jgi:serine/threonine protein kinase
VFEIIYACVLSDLLASYSVGTKGSYRSPEEYAGQSLTHQIDMFSLGHVLFEIWTGENPWEDTGVKRIRDAVQDGQMPPKLRHLLENSGAGPKQDGIDGDNSRDLTYAVGQLIAQCYTVDPHQRISADRLVDELTRLRQSLWQWEGS